MNQVQQSCDEKPPARPRSRLLTTLKWLAAAMGLALLVGSALGVRDGMTREYGHFELARALVRYMKANDNRWPGGWEELRPHLRNGVFFSVASARDEYRIAWDIDPFEIAVANKDMKPAEGEVACPVIHRRFWEERTRGKKIYWILHQEVRAYIHSLKTP